MHQSQKAFTLIELLVSIAIFSILVGFGVSSFNSIMLNNTSSTLGGEFVDALNFARLEALKTSSSVTVCASNPAGTDCGNNWNNGWLVVRDSVASPDAAAPIVSGVDKILKRSGPLHTLARFTFAAPRTFIRFANMGVLGRNQNPANVDLNVNLQGCTGNSAKRIQISLSGMISATSAACVP